MIIQKFNNSKIPSKADSNLEAKDISLFNYRNSSNLQLKNNKNNNIIVYNIINNSNNKKEKHDKNNYDLKESNKLKQILPISLLNDRELNTLDYNIAQIFDKRTYFQYYWSLLKKKHLIIFTFLPINDYNLQFTMYKNNIIFIIIFLIFYYKGLFFQ